MRDDLHVGAPLKPRWRGVIKAMTREGWQEEAVAHADRAIIRDVLDLVRPSFLGGVIDLVRAASSPTFFGPPTPLNLGKAFEQLERKHCPNQLEAKCLAHLKLSMGNLNALNSHQVVEGSITNGVREFMGGIKDDTLLHIAEKSFSDLKEARRRLSKIISSVGVEALTKKLVEGTLQAPPRIRRKPVDLDNEDLR